MRPEELQHLMHSIDLARKARARGDHPFGSVLVDVGGKVLLEGENTVETTRDCTGHAESNLMREATQRYAPELLADCTLYASTEPCAMCAGAIFWGGVRRVVFALSSEQLGQLIHPSAPALRMSCREVFARGSEPTEVVGPVELPEAREVHAGFWK
ncbi:nucleoside deaminase [Vitiosangium sp. GDMCC 1.1324]|uniref:nucleoside deaminase n=1 Tax=Vitiosangium sp. (strain GDMCC 1.1324) TaxID=2138576 RepID=UPI000D3A9851|nr:nucleoside deaminase [Vitiosangium sp. GDMCC 1.1324]PTL84398.1 nucleoside deaminase [Vitiosangium sp. GDMCC 1.1324]